MPARGGETQATALLLPGSLGRNGVGGVVRGLRGGKITSSGIHRQIIHLGLFLGYLQLFYIKTWIVCFKNEH